MDDYSKGVVFNLKERKPGPHYSSPVGQAKDSLGEVMIALKIDLRSYLQSTTML